MRLRPLADEAGAELRTWHFIRYSDPEPHLRIRFGGAPEALLHEVLPAVSAILRAAVAEGTCARFSVETYDRELERFGGPVGTAIAETVFGIDTRATMELLALARAPGFALDETLLAVLSVDEFLAGLGLEPEARLELIGPHGWRGPGAGAQFRARRDELRACLADRGRAAGAALTAVLHERADALALCVREMENAQAELAAPELLDRMRRTFIHLHLNRLAGPTRQREAELIDLLRRTRLSLREHPSG
jgi:thiopeptide-type bacteriocin biosynthesis protein